MSQRGWALARAAGLVLVVAFLSPVSPVVLALVPLAIMLLAYQPGRPSALLLAVAILFLAFGQVPEDPTPLWYAGRGWALCLGGAFVVSGLVVERSGVLGRGLLAVAASFAIVAVSGLLRPGLVAELDWWVGDELGRAARAASRVIGEGEVWERLGTSVSQIVEVQVVLYPALLALASLAALGVGWFVVQRFDGGIEPLAPLREFRFSDQLVWVLIVGLLLFLVPAGDLATRLGENAVVFMGGLYLLRGLAILVWLGAAVVTSGWTAALWLLAALLFYPLLVGAALLMGLSDTWLHVRERLRKVAGDDR